MVKMNETVCALHYHDTKHATQSSLVIVHLHSCTFSSFIMIFKVDFCYIVLSWKNDEIKLKPFTALCQRSA